MKLAASAVTILMTLQALHANENPYATPLQNSPSAKACRAMAASGDIFEARDKVDRAVEALSSELSLNKSHLSQQVSSFVKKDGIHRVNITSLVVNPKSEVTTAQISERLRQVLHELQPRFEATKEPSSTSKVAHGLKCIGSVCFLFSPALLTATVAVGINLNPLVYHYPLSFLSFVTVPTLSFVVYGYVRDEIQYRKMRLGRPQTRLLTEEMVANQFYLSTYTHLLNEIKVRVEEGSLAHEDTQVVIVTLGHSVSGREFVQD